MIICSCKLRSLLRPEEQIRVVERAASARRVQSGRQPRGGHQAAEREGTRRVLRAHCARPGGPGGPRALPPHGQRGRAAGGNAGQRVVAQGRTRGPAETGQLVRAAGSAAGGLPSVPHARGLQGDRLEPLDPEAGRLRRVPLRGPLRVPDRAAPEPDEPRDHSGHNARAAGGRRDPRRRRRRARLLSCAPAAAEAAAPPAAPAGLRGRALLRPGPHGAHRVALLRRSPFRHIENL